MTMPQAPGVPTRTIELPAPGYPMLSLLVSNNPDNPESPGMHWLISKPHPLVPGMHVQRMFISDRGGVEIYSSSTDGKVGVRDFIPMPHVRLAQEAMPLDIFVEELAAAEAGDPDPDDDPDDPEYDDQAPSVARTEPPPAPPNGQPVS